MAPFADNDLTYRVIGCAMSHEFDQAGIRFTRHQPLWFDIKAMTSTANTGWT
jgi:hypothetical protein